MSAGQKKEAPHAAAPPSHAAVAPDLDQRLANWRPVKMPFNATGLSERERQEVEKLVEASRYLEDIFWRQSDREGLKLFRRLEGSRNPRDIALRRFLMINGGRFDLLDNNKSFVDTEPLPLGRGFYPPGVTRKDIENYVEHDRTMRATLYSPCTIVVRGPSAGEHPQPLPLILEPVPYHVVYARFLRPAAAALREAAALSDDQAFANFLRLRADALLTDEYAKSDLAWLDLDNPRIDVIFAPYETYLDGVLGVKAAYGAAVLVRNDFESEKLALYQKYIPELQEALPLAPDDRPSKRGQRFPMEVVDAPFRAGDLRHGYQAVADSLPNDPRVTRAKGTKKIFFKNFMDARVKEVILPLSRRLMRADQAAQVTGDGSLAFVILHEISHGLGPAYARRGDRQVNVREAIGPVLSALEEAKADVTGMFCLKWLLDRSVLPASRLEEYYASYLGDTFRTVRYGTAEAHGQAAMMEFNFLSAAGAITPDAVSGRYVIDYVRMPEAFARLARQLLEFEARGDRDGAEQWFKRYRTMPAELAAALNAVTDVPVDVGPIFDFPDRIE